MDEKAQELAQALIDAGKREYTETFNISNTDEKIVVLVVRAQAGAPMMRSIAEAVKAVGKPAGQVCPRCGGTGRI